MDPEDKPTEKIERVTQEPTQVLPTVPAADRTEVIQGANEADALDLASKDKTKLFLQIFVAAALLVIAGFLIYLLMRDNQTDDLATEATTSTTISTGTTEDEATTTTDPSEALATTPLPVTSNHCTVPNLEASVAEARGAEHMRSFRIAVRARAASPDCSLTGFPAVTLFNDTDAIRSTTNNTGDDAPKQLKAGQTAHFEITYKASTDQDCPTATVMQITTPGDDQYLRLPLEGSDIARVCEGTELQISAFQ